jgi:hypothetical protein
MSGQIVYSPPTPHRCDIPYVDSHQEGTIWLCDDCNEFQIVRRKWSKQHKAYQKSWETLSKREMRKLEASKGISVESNH